MRFHEEDPGSQSGMTTSIFPCHSEHADRHDSESQSPHFFDSANNNPKRACLLGQAGPGQRLLDFMRKITDRDRLTGQTGHLKSCFV
ncbi:MAG: hypothetical protein K9J12_12755 [Melioribacteraceae bacterium]|nr:hypothetical protein [Melioribacteraceae bacterium]